MSSSTSNLLEDIKSLDGKASAQKFQIVNRISRKTLNNEYDAAEIKSYVKSFTNSEDDYFIRLVVQNLIADTKSSEGVMKFLKSENDELITRAIRNCKFFWSDEKVDIDFCINAILPHISYSNRMQLIETIGNNLKNEQKAEECFKELKNKFSMTSARPILKYCSDDFITEHLKRGIALTYKEILRILPQRSNFVARYLRILYDMIKTMAKFSGSIQTRNFEKVFKKLLLTHPRETIEIFNDHKDCMQNMPHLGRKLTKRVMMTSKDVIFQNSDYFEQYLRREMVYKYLSEDEYKIFYKGLFPEKKEEFSMEPEGKILENLDYYHKNKEKKLKLLLDTYSSVYNDDLLDSFSNLTPELMKLLSTEKRVDFTQKMVAIQTEGKRKPEDCKIPADELVCYLTCDVALPKLKEKIYACADSIERGKYMTLMVKCCEINEDMTAFLDVLKYFNQRHRNELSQVRSDFLRVVSSSIDLKQLNAEHWKEIQELFQVMIIYQEMGHNYHLKKLVTSYVEYQFENGLPIEECLRVHVIYSVENYDRGWTMFENRPKYQRKYLHECTRLVPEIQNQKALYSWHGVLESFQKWNKNHPDDVISAVNYQWLCEQIDKTIEEKDSHAADSIHKCFKYDRKSADVYLEKLKDIERGSIRDFEFYMKENPEAIHRHFDNFCKYSLEYWDMKRYTLPLIRSGKFRQYPDVEEKFKKYLFDIMKIPDDSNNADVKLKSTAIRILVHWLEPEKFFELVEEYAPKQGRIDVGKKNADNFYAIQTSIAHCLKHFNGYEQTFEALRRFCVGDYLKLTVGSLNSVCMKSPYNKTKEFLGSCLDTPVSFKKHIIRLQCLISDQIYFVDFLQKLWAKEKNPSIREVVLKNIFNYFVFESNSETWSLLRNCVKSLTSKDISSLRTVTRFEVISTEYISEYLELIWDVLKRLQRETVDVASFKQDLLSTLQNSLDDVAESVTMHILHENLFEDDIHKVSYDELAAHFILQSPTSDDQAKRIQLIADKIKKTFALHWADRTTGDIEVWTAKKLINNLLMTFWRVAVAERIKYKNTHLALVNFKEKLYEVFDPSITIYRVFIQLQFAILFIQNSCFRDFGRNIRRIIEDEIAAHETYIVPCLASLLKSFLQSVEKVEIHEVIDGLLHSPLQSIGCVLMAINLVGPRETFKKEYESMLNYLRTIDDKRVQIYLNSLE